MDGRRKNIRDLEQQREKDLESLDLMLKTLGEALLIRRERGEASGFSAETGEYRRLVREIAVSEDAIKAARAEMERFKELEERIAAADRETAERTRQNAELNISLGELLLEDDALGDFTAPYRRQIAALVPKIRSLERRLEELEDKDGSGVFSWIGKGAQGLVLRSFLGKSRGNLRHIWGSAGEQFILTEKNKRPPAGAEALKTCGEIGRVRASLDDLNREGAALRDERQKLFDSFAAGAYPAKRIQTLEKNLLRLRGDLSALALSFGGALAGGSPLPEDLSGEDRLLLEKTGALRETIKTCEGQIEKLKSSLAIDEEKRKIAGMRRSIEHHKKRIAAGEAAIADLEEHIAGSNRRIEELQRWQ
jgi:septal ring factor EnvC (AmiA/AmiB activator)